MKMGMAMSMQDNENGTDAEGTMEMPETIERALEMLATELIPLRSEAVSARLSSGIEARWRYAEEAIDGENASAPKPLKPSGLDQSFVLMPQPRADRWARSTAVYNITAPYTLLAAKRPHEMLFPTDARSWELRRTPRTSVDEIRDWLRANAQRPEDLQLVAGIVEGLTLEREEEIERAQDQIDDWLRESPEPFVDVAEALLYDAARLGVGVLKGPVPLLSASGASQPGVLLLSPWSLYPAKGCGEDIQKGNYIWEREEISTRLLREKMAQSEMGWIADALEDVIAEGPKTFVAGEMQDSKVFELWHFQGEVSLQMLAACGCDMTGLEEKRVWANITLCNDRIVRVGRAPLQQRFTYCALPWRKRHGFWAGIGVPEDLEDIQRSLNSQLRNLNDNSALSAVPQIVVWKGMIEPVDGSFDLAPGKTWNVNVDSGDALLPHVKNAIFTIEIPSRLDELRANVQLFLSLAEQVTGISGVALGLTQPTSVGGGQIQMNASGFYSRRIARNWDAFVLRPLVQSFVQWLADFGPVPVKDVTVSVFGSTVLVERDLQAQAVMAAVQLAANPIYGQDPEKMMEQWLLSNKFDPAKTRMGPDRRAQIEALIASQQQGSGAPAPQVQSATIRAQALTQQAQIEAQSDQARLAGQLEDSARKRAHEKDLKVLQAKMDLLSYAAQKGIDLQAAQHELENVTFPGKLMESELSAPALPVKPEMPGAAGGAEAQHGQA